MHGADYQRLQDIGAEQRQLIHRLVKLKAEEDAIRSRNAVVWQVPETLPQMPSEPVERVPANRTFGAHSDNYQERKGHADKVRHDAEQRRAAYFQLGRS